MKSLLYLKISLSLILIILSCVQMYRGESPTWFITVTPWAILAWRDLSELLGESK